MAEVDIGGQLSGITSSLGGVTDAALWIGLALAVFAVLGFILWYTGFKHEVLFRVQTRNGGYVRRMRAKTVMEDGAHYWVIFPTRKVTAPPKDCINMTKKGRYWAEAQISEENPEPTWVREMDGPGMIEPLTTEQRALYVSQLREAETRRKKKISELIAAAVPYLAIIIIFGMVLIFWENITAPSLAAMGNIAEQQETQLKIAEKQEKITSDLARIFEVGGISIDQEIPPEERQPE